MRALKLTNLPSLIQPSHLDHILSRSGIPDAKPRDAGVTLIEVYTVPRKAKRTIFKHLQLTPGVQDDPKLSDSPGLLHNSPITPTLPTSSPDTLTLLNEDQVPLIEVTDSTRTKKTIESEETIAYVHFKRDSDLFRAKLLLRRMTIDGRRVHVKEKRWTTAGFRRFLKKAGLRG